MTAVGRGDPDIRQEGEIERMQPTQFKWVDVSITRSALVTVARAHLEVKMLGAAGRGTDRADDVPSFHAGVHGREGITVQFFHVAVQRIHQCAIRHGVLDHDHTFFRIPTGGIAVRHAPTRRGSHRIAEPAKSHIDSGVPPAPLGAVDFKIIALEIDPRHGQIKTIDITAGSSVTLGGGLGKSGDTQADNQQTNNKPSPIDHDTSAIKTERQTLHRSLDCTGTGTFSLKPSTLRVDRAADTAASPRRNNRWGCGPPPRITRRKPGLLPGCWRYTPSSSPHRRAGNQE